MTPVKNFYKQIEEADLTCVRIYDKYGNKIHERELDSSDELVEHLKGIHETFKLYGACEMWCGTTSQGKANFKGAFKWKVTFATEKEAAAVQSGTSEVSRMKETLELMMMMKSVFGNNDNDTAKLQKELLDAKLEVIKATNGIELKKLELHHSDPVNQWGWIAPVALNAMGKTPAEISQMLSLMSMGKVAGNAVPATTNAPAFTKSNWDDLLKMPIDEKNKKIDALMLEVNKVISAEQYILLLEMILEKPSRVNQAIQAAAQGII